MFCSQCGAQVPSGARFCNMCGTRVDAPGVVPEPQALTVGQPIVSIRGEPAPYGVDPVSGLPFSHRSKVVAGVLQLALGGFGVGRFYSGHPGIAIAQIVVTFVTCGIGILWPLIDGIVLLAGNPRDGNGRPMKG